MMLQETVKIRSVVQLYFHALDRLLSGKLTRREQTTAGILATRAANPADINDLGVLE